MNTRVEVSGLDEIREALGRGGRVVAEKCKVVLSLKADEIISLARPNVPLQAGGGALRDSLRKARASYSEGRGVLSQAIVIGGDPVANQTHGRPDAKLRKGAIGPVRKSTGYNIFAVLMEHNLGVHSPFHHDDGEAHAVENAVMSVAPSIPDALLDAITPDDFGGN